MARAARAARTVAALVAAIAIGTWTPNAAGAAELREVGWWWKPNAGGSIDGPGQVPDVGLPVTAPAPPAPSSVPEGGLFVARDTDGAFAMAAVRFTLDEADRAPVLTLTVVDGGETAVEGDLLACHTGSTWTGAHGGRWDSKPLVACDPNAGGGAVVGARASDGGAWTFDLSPLISSGGDLRVIDLAIVPTADSDGEAVVAVQQPFQIAFAPPNTASLAVNVAQTAPPSFESPGDDRPGTNPSAGGAAAGALAPVPFAPPLPQPALPPQDQGLAQTGPVRSSPASSGSDDSVARRAAVAVLMAGAVAVFIASQHRVPAPRTLARISPHRPVEHARSSSL